MSASHLLETVRWNDGRVRILDQTRLPETEVYLDLGTVQDLIGAIQSLAVRGAPALGVAGAYGLAMALHRSTAIDAPSLRADIDREGARLAAARPTAVNLKWAIDRVRAVAHAASQQTTTGGVAARALAEAHLILEEDLELSERMAAHGFDLLPDGARVFTHCNTGGLATGGGGTALGVVLSAFARGKRLFVHAGETRPLGQGARLTAWELARAGIPHALHCDGAGAWLLKHERAHAVLVGADRIAANGDTANKIGTYALALAAREAGTPFYVVAPRSSFDLSLADGTGIPIEERSAEEVTGVRPGWSPLATAARNPAFDVTPASLIAGWVTERGVERPPFASTEGGAED